MKRLLLIRHAKSSWVDLSQRDIDRPLDLEGVRSAEAMAGVLREKDYVPDAIFVSPSQRTRSTAELIFPHQKYQIVENFYGADVGEIMAFIRQCDTQVNTIALVGHNPTFTLLHQRIIGKSLTHLPPCGVITVTSQCESWSDLDNHTTEESAQICSSDVFW